MRQRAAPPGATVSRSNSQKGVGSQEVVSGIRNPRTNGTDGTDFYHVYTILRLNTRQSVLILLAGYGNLVRSCNVVVNSLLSSSPTPLVVDLLLINIVTIIRSSGNEEPGFLLLFLIITIALYVGLWLDALALGLLVTLIRARLG